MPEHVFDTVSLDEIDVSGRLAAVGASSSPSTSVRKTRLRRQYSMPNSPRPIPARHIHSHQVRPSSSSAP